MPGKENKVISSVVVSERERAQTIIMLKPVCVVILGLWDKDVQEIQFLCCYCILKLNGSGKDSQRE